MAFLVGGEEFTWGDVVADARRRGAWAEVDREIRADLDCARRLRDTGCEPARAEVRAAATAFRYRHRLIAAEDLEAWLAARELTTAEWTDWVRRNAARRSSSPPAVEATAAEATVDDDEVSGVAWVTVVCSGALARLAHDLAGRAAARQRLADQGFDLGRDEAYRRFCTAAVTARRIDATIASHYLEWMVVEADWTRFADEDSAREAMLCVRDDGCPLAEVGARAGFAADHRRFLVEDVEPELRHRFRAVAVGEVVGPLPDGGGFAVAAVTAKVPPSPEDELVRRRAEAEVVAAAVEREIENRVKWIDRL